ncbi:MAG: peptidylprolyl isomerase [Planctomycetota bacterium]
MNRRHRSRIVRAGFAASLTLVGLHASATFVTDQTTVRIATTLGDIDVTFYDQATPLSVDNFFDYADVGAYDDVMIHRAPVNFVAQTGRYTWNDDGFIRQVTSGAPVLNEPGISNTRGTVAYAKRGGDPNSATSEWFVNTTDNSANLDFQNGGFTVFGKVVGNGMDVVDAIDALRRINFVLIPDDPDTDVDDSLVLEDFPIVGELVNGFISRDNSVRIESITRIDVLQGDFDNNGAVEQGDLNLVLNNWGQTASSLDVGLYGYGPGTIDQTALNAVLNNWGSQAAPSFEGSVVPEPAALGLGLAALGLLARRRPARA